MALLTIASAFLGLAQTASAAPHKDVIVKANWISTPSPEAVQGAYPIAASTASIRGRVILDCIAQIDGTANNCRTSFESPPGFGFGDAAISMAPQFHFSPQTVNGVPTPATVRIPINFDPVPLDQPKLPTLSLSDAIAKDPEAVKDAREVSRKLAQLDPTVLLISDLYRKWMRAIFEDDTGKLTNQINSTFALALNELSRERQDRVTTSLVMDLTGQQIKDVRAFLETPSGTVFAGNIIKIVSQSSAGNDDLIRSFVSHWEQNMCTKTECSNEQTEKFKNIRQYMESYLISKTNSGSDHSAPSLPEAKR